MALLALIMVVGYAVYGTRLVKTMTQSKSSNQGIQPGLRSLHAGVTLISLNLRFLVSSETDVSVLCIRSESRCSTHVHRNNGIHRLFLHRMLHCNIQSLFPPTSLPMLCSGYTQW